MNSNDLKPGDVLLYSGQSMIGKLIRKLDGADVTHAGVYLGNGKVGEALMLGSAGINANAFSLTESNWIEVRRLKDKQLCTQPIIEIAENYIAQGNDYAYAEIFLVSVILLTRKINFDNSLFGRIVFSLMRKTNDWLNDVFHEGKEPMICSEFVFRCYDEADPADDDAYSLTILSQAGREPRRKSSRRRLRRQERLSQAQPESDIPTIHSESLLAAALSETDALKEASAPAFSDVEISDQDLDSMIADYLGEAPLGGAIASGAATAPEINEAELKAEAFRLINNLASISRPIFREGVHVSASTEARVKATFADFVTPSDLLTCPSLKTIGRIVP